MDCLRGDWIYRGFRCIRNNIELANLLLSTISSLNTRFVADEGFLVIPKLASNSRWNEESCDITSGASSDGQTPTRASSFHSNITRLTTGSESLSGSAFTKVVEMNGSVSPPQDALLYMPLHCRLFASVWSYTAIRNIREICRGCVITIWTSPASTVRAKVESRKGAV